MKKSLLTALILLTGSIPGVFGQAQPALAPDQNPNFAVSRDKYMKIADSLNTWHSTTFQENYRAIDWIADRQQARADRREFRRQLRLETARWYGDYYYDDYYYNPYRGYRNRHYNNRYYDNYNHRNRHRGNHFYISPWGLGYWWR